MKGVMFAVGYSRGGGLSNYHTKEYKNLEGADLIINDEIGNTIEICVRDGQIGHRVKVNGKIVSEKEGEAPNSRQLSR